MSLKKKLFMINKLWIDLRSPKRHYEIADELHSQNIAEYYFRFNEKAVASGKNQKLIKSLDENGIPINRTYIDVKGKDNVYYPISISQLGLAVYHTYLKTKSDEDKNRFLKFADWFAHENNYNLDDKLGLRWLTNVPLPQYKNAGPWQSAFSQSRGISVLTRGYQITNKTEWRDKAQLALRSFEFSVEEGGVTAFTDFGPFYEEYTSEVPTLVLNGKIFTLCGLNDYYRAFPEDNLGKLILEEGINTLQNILPQYDLGNWSRYNLCKADWYPSIDPATIGYQRLHVTQLEMMYKLTGNNIFNKYAEIFDEQDTLSNAIKMYFNKYKALKKIGRL